MKLKNIFIGMVAAVIAAVSMIFTVSADFGKMNELSGATFTLEGKLSSSIRPKIAATLQGVYVFSQDGYFAAKRLNSTIGSYKEDGTVSIKWKIPSFAAKNFAESGIGEIGFMIGLMNDAGQLKLSVSKAELNVGGTTYVLSDYFNSNTYGALKIVPEFQRLMTTNAAGTINQMLGSFSMSELESAAIIFGDSMYYIGVKGKNGVLTARDPNAPVVTDPPVIVTTPPPATTTQKITTPAPVVTTPKVTTSTNKPTNKPDSTQSSATPSKTDKPGTSSSDSSAEPIPGEVSSATDGEPTGTTSSISDEEKKTENVTTTEDEDGTTIGKHTTSDDDYAEPASDDGEKKSRLPLIILMVAVILGGGSTAVTVFIKKKKKTL